MFFKTTKDVELFLSDENIKLIRDNNIDREKYSITLKAGSVLQGEPYIDYAKLFCKIMDVLGIILYIVVIVGIMTWIIRCISMLYTQYML